MMRLLLLLCCTLSFSSLLLASESFDINAHTSSQKKSEVYANNFIAAGDFDKANLLLSTAVKKYPNSDLILSLYGKSLFESGKQDKAETYFMKALKLNARNSVAQSYINKIRQIRISTRSETAQEWDLIIKDKAADLIVFILSIWIGTSLNSSWIMLSNKYKWYRAQLQFRKRKYKDVVRILENHVQNMNQDEVEHCLTFMLGNNHSANELLTIIKQYVIRDEDYIVIERSLRLLNETTINEHDH